MQKVLLGGRVWVMTGRWRLMSLERPLERPRIVERAWFRSIHAPYWRGAGVALTVGPWSLQCGRCTKGLDVEESEDEFDWSEFGAGFDEHLDASLFESAGEGNIDDTIGGLEIEPVTVFVDLRTNAAFAIVHTGGDVEFVEPKVRPYGQVPHPS